MKFETKDAAIKFRLEALGHTREGNLWTANPDRADKWGCISHFDHVLAELFALAFFPAKMRLPDEKIPSSRAPFGYFRKPRPLKTLTPAEAIAADPRDPNVIFPEYA